MKYLFALFLSLSLLSKSNAQKKELPSINLDKYITVDDATAISELDNTYPNTVIGSIENFEKLLYSRKFNLVAHVIEKFGVKPTQDYLRSLNQYNFVCGVGLKRTKDVSPACLQPKVYTTNPDSENKVKLATLILSKGVTADYYAASGCIGKNELELFKVLYANMVKTEPNSFNGEKLLVDAADMGCYDIVKYLLETNVNPNGYDHFSEQQDSRFYAIYRAVKYPEIFYLMVDKGAEINIKGYKNTTPIIHAAREGCLEVLQYLLDKKIDPNEKQGDMSAVDMAKKFNQKNKKEVLDLFKKYKAG